MNAVLLKEKARSFGADLIGIAPVERFKDVPADKNPLSVFPECKSVIVVARRVLRGSIRGIEEGTNFNSTYGFFGYRALEDNFLSKMTYDLTCWIEEQSYEAVPLFAYHDAGMPKGVPVEPGKPAPNVIVDFEFAAHAAGLAEMGLGKFVLTPEYGTRQRFALILTDAELDADKVRSKSICGDCKACIDACPLKAYNTEKIEKFGMKGNEMDVMSVDFALCDSCPNGATRAPGRGIQPDRIAAACGRACMVQLEKNDKCSNKFENKFRKRKPWALDIMKKPIEDSTVLDASSRIGCGKKN